MAVIRLDNGRKIGDYMNPYIVAEVNSSHNGNVETAKKMIYTAKEIGCDCVKFQSWFMESLYSASYYEANPIAKRIVSKFALSEDDLLEVVSYCREQNIAFSSTPYSEQEVDFLVVKCHLLQLHWGVLLLRSTLRWIRKKWEWIIIWQWSLMNLNS